MIRSLEGWSNDPSAELLLSGTHRSTD
jgi:hypothetical protein